MESSARHFEKRPDSRVACTLCPNACIIADGKHGLCRVRFNRGGTLEIPFYGRVSALSMDPIEKKPLYHFYPGMGILSAGFVGCSFHCGFCQNWHISQGTEASTRFLAPHKLVETAVREHSFGIAYTYSEPLIHAEYILDTARLAREHGLKNVLVSNGYINEGPGEEVVELLDAANIDLKGFDPGFYRNETGGKLEEVLRFLRQAAGRIHLEVTTLVIPTKNDDPSQIDGIARFIASLDPSIPLHLSCYHPQHKYTIPPTTFSTVKALAEVAKKHLHYVYLGNVGVEETNTYCPSCGNLLVRRVGYSVHLKGTHEDKCAKCGVPTGIVGAP